MHTEKKAFIDETNTWYWHRHPSLSAYSGFSGNKHFSRANEYLIARRRNPYSGKSSFNASSNRATRITTLVPFQCIRQQVSKLHGYWNYKSKRTEHQTTQLILKRYKSTDIHCCHRRHLLGIKVITGRTVNVPTAALIYITRYVQWWLTHKDNA